MSTATPFFHHRALPFCPALLDLAAIDLFDTGCKVFWIYDLTLPDAARLYWNLEALRVAFAGSVVVYNNLGDAVTSVTAYDQTLAGLSARAPRTRVCLNAEYWAAAGKGDVEAFTEGGDNFTIQADATLIPDTITRQTDGLYTLWFQLAGYTYTNGSPTGSVGGSGIGGIYSGIGGGGKAYLAGGSRIDATLTTFDILGGHLDAYFYALDPSGAGSYGDSYISGGGTISYFEPSFYSY